MDDFYRGARTNVTFLTGMPQNGKTTWLYDMLAKRKQNYINKIERRIRARFLREQKEKMTKNIGVAKFTQDDEEALLDFIDTDTEWQDFHNFLSENPDSEMGYGCHVISLKQIEKDLYPNGYKTERQRDKVVQKLIKEIWESLCPKGMPVERPIFNTKGEFTGKFGKEYVPLLPKNIFVDGTISQKECKKIISELKSKAHSRFIMCYYTCFVFSKASFGNDSNWKFEYSEPDKECRLNAKYWINLKGISKHEVYDENDLL